MAALFQSLLFEACGRTVNPVNGAVGLLSSGNWHLCQAAVDTVLRGGVLRPFPPELLAHALTSPPRAAIIPTLINGAQAVNPATMMRFWASDHAVNLQQTTSLGSCGMSGMTSSSFGNSSSEENDRDAPAGGGQKRKLLNLFV